LSAFPPSAITWLTRTARGLALACCVLVCPAAFAETALAAYTPPVRAEAPAPALALVQPTIRFLLTFDDGPSASEFENSTISILDDLLNNPIQPGIKAIFFVQTRATGGGGTELGRKILQRETREGHLLGFHTATDGHSGHRRLPPETLDRSIYDGILDITAITGGAPKLMRPPFWDYDRRTYALYRQHGLHVLMTDLNANDGKTWGMIASPRRRSHLLQQLAKVRDQIEAGTLKKVDADIPVVVSFHDVNRYTAGHMQEYLEILVESARELGLRTAAKPFYDNRQEMEVAAISRSVGQPDENVPLGFWARLWQ
jgi:peptidoglycan/xylan/chitin deacetylase (PgdA/CDA1 family)